MKRQKKVLFVVPDGIGIKNYLYSKVITHLKKLDFKIAIWSPLPKEVFDKVEDLHNISFEYKCIRLLPEPALAHLFREATTYARLKYNAKLKNNPSILFNFPNTKGYSKRAFMSRIAKLLGTYIGKDYQRILAFEGKYNSKWKTSIIEQYKTDLEALNPHSLFITHQRVANLMPVCLAAEALGITINTAIFSWDNLPKARLSIKADNYLVWGKWMQQEMEDYYPEISPDRLKLVGTPQFEFYLDKKKIWTKEKFSKHYNLDVNKKWICFSGDDERTSPYDPQYLYDLAEKLESRNDIQIIFRRCPADFTNRYNEVLKKFKSMIIAIDPIWNNITGNWGGRYPDYEDTSLQINLAKHCLMVINIGSTMAFDFSIFNKPCVYINYDVADNLDWSVKIVYQFQHFRSMKDLEGVVWLNSKKEISRIISQIIDNGDIWARDKEKWRDRVVLSPLTKSSKLIAEQLVLNETN